MQSVGQNKYKEYTIVIQFPIHEKNRYNSMMNKLHLTIVKINRQGYDAKGHQWGVGVPLYRAWDDEGEVFIRAATREKAKAALKAGWSSSPWAGQGFYR